VGCKSIDVNGNDSSVGSEKEDPWWKRDDRPPVKPASKIVAIWSNSVVNETGEVPQRGLGGRVYFYDSKHQPARVDGKLTVFLYDDTNKTDDETQEATRKIHFSPEEVAANYTPSAFGPSYSFWLPWDAVGGERTQLSVIPVFTSREGEMLVGKQAHYLLPGKKPGELAKESSQKTGGVVAASFDEESNGSSKDRLFDDEAVSKLRLTSSIIKVPRSVQERLRQPSHSVRTRKSGSMKRTNEKAEGGPISIPHKVSIVQSQDKVKLASTNAAETGSFPASNGAANTTEQPSADSPRDRPQPQTWQSAQQAFAREPIQPVREGSRFAR